MKNFKLTSLALVISAALVGCDSDDIKEALDIDNEPLELTILHMNDHHSHIAAEDFGFDVSGLSLDTKTEDGASIEEVNVTYGGFPMMVSLFDKLASENANVLKLHSGDAITGTLYYSLFNGEADAAVMNEICFDAFALGNHEFDDGDTGLANFLDALNSTDCNTPTLAANVVPATDSAIADGYIEPYTIIERDGQKIGIIGIDIASKTKNSSSPDKETQFLDETTTAQTNIDLLRAQGINKIILMTHYQYENDLKLAAALNGVDVIVGGDSHTLLGDSSFNDLGFNPVAEYPTQVVNADNDPVCVVQAWEYAHIMGELKVSFDKDGVVTQCAGQPYMPIMADFEYEYSDSEDKMLTDADKTAVTTALTTHSEVVVTTPDTATATLLSGFDEQVDVLKETVIGSSVDDLCLVRFPGESRSSICDKSETYEHGSDISNIVAKAFLMVTPTADIAIQNGGGVRVDVVAQDYTIADAFTLLPFSNTLVTLELTGQQVIDVLEDALDAGLNPDGSTGAYPYASGLRFDVDASQDKGSRISNVEVNSQVATTWTDINLTTTYTIATNDFIASGQDGYDTFGVVYDQGKFVNTYTEYAQGFIDYVNALTANNETLQKLPVAEYSTKSYIDPTGCDHSTVTTCAD
ncbi:NAD nucleotidase [Colwellia sp. E2M01]|uniref:NAD nucleotidase n=1 Tax=Colwellia sp. E2M01 TaxID=2841561 RepID=UPI001C0A3115|nr:NAD nucleotidase [Colwellia sp. E2M01]MBU2871508.1 NAD nucleotidase [Colwellia sp. E2M01]